MLRQLNERMQKWGFSWESLRDNRHGESRACWRS
jgi:hypothetical protein